MFDRDPLYYEPLPEVCYTSRLDKVVTVLDTNLFKWLATVIYSYEFASDEEMQAETCPDTETYNNTVIELKTLLCDLADAIGLDHDNINFIADYLSN